MGISRQIVILICANFLVFNAVAEIEEQAVGKKALLVAIDEISEDQEHAQSANHFNLRVHPLHFLVALPKMSINWIFADRLSLGIEGAYLVLDDHIQRAVRNSQVNLVSEEYDLKANMIGVRFDFALNETLHTSTFYIAPKYSKLNMSIDDHNLGITSHAKVELASLIVGYQWMWDHFNLQLGVGGTSVTHKEYELGDSPIDGDEIKDVLEGNVEFEFSLGVAF